MKHVVMWALVCCAFGCKGNASIDTSEGKAGGGENGGTKVVDINNVNVPVNEDILGVVTVGARRLTQAEYNSTVEYLTGDTTNPASAFPEDNIAPFANNWSNQLVSRTLIEGAEIAAISVAQRFAERTDRIAEIAECNATGPDDADCFQSFVENFGRRAFRRSLSDEEVQSFMTLQSYSVEDNRFETGVSFVVQAMLQMPDFLYITAKGIPLDSRPNIVRLTPHEVATRLSFFLWGQSPDDILLDAAEKGELITSEQIRAQAVRLLEDERARQRIRHFHAMWMGYLRFGTDTTLAQAMVSETEALIDRVVFDEERNYFDLFTFDETLVTPELANHYGLTPEGGGSFVTTERINPADFTGEGSAVGGEWELLSAGTIVANHSFATAGDYRFVVNARQEQAGPDNAQMVLRIGNQIVETFEVEATSLTNFEAVATVPAGSQDVSIEFTNDYFINPRVFVLNHHV